MGLQKIEKDSNLIKDLAAQFFLRDLDDEIDGTFALSIVIIATIILAGFLRYLLSALFDFDWLNPYSQVMLMAAVVMICLLASGLTVGIYVRIHNRRRRDRLVKTFYAMTNSQLPMWRDYGERFAKISQDTIGRNCKNGMRSSGYAPRDFWVECPIIERYVAIGLSRKVAKMLRSEFEKLTNQWFLCFGLWADTEHHRLYGVDDAAKCTERELCDAISIYRMLYIKVEKECAAAVREATRAK